MRPSRPTKIKPEKPPEPPKAEPETETEKDPGRYMRRTSLIAKPTLGNPVIVTKVGLGNLTVQTAHGTDSNHQHV